MNKARSKTALLLPDLSWFCAQTLKDRQFMEFFSFFHNNYTTQAIQACCQWYLQMNILQTKLHINIFLYVERSSLKCLLFFSLRVYICLGPHAHELPYGWDWPVSSAETTVFLIVGCHYQFLVSNMSWVLTSSSWPHSSWSSTSFPSPQHCLQAPYSNQPVAKYTSRDLAPTLSR